MANIRKAFYGGKKIEMPIWNGVVPYALYYNGECVWKNDSSGLEYEYDFILEFIVPNDYNDNVLTMWIPVLETNGHIGSIDWGDNTVEAYKSSLEYEHTFENIIPNQILTVKIACSIEEMVSFQYPSRIFHTYLTKIYFPDTLKNVGAWLFGEDGTVESKYKYLEYVDFNNVENVNVYAFKRVKNLKIINAEKVLKIGTEAFMESGVEEVYLPKCTIIDYNGFNGCENLKIVELNSITHLIGRCFEDCVSLEEISLPNTITDISYEHFDEMGYPYYNAFQNCTNLKKITIDRPKDSIVGSPWGATNATIIWTG